MTTNNDNYHFKILIVGYSGVGKGSLQHRFAEDMFCENYISTVGVNLIERKMELNGKNVILQIWDPSGGEKVRMIMKCYYRSSSGVVVVYDITDRESFNQVQSWMSDIDNHASTNVCRLLVGNKCDLNNERKVKTEEGESLAQQYGIPFFETSAKESVNVNEMFRVMVNILVERSAMDDGKGDPIFQVDLKKSVPKSWNKSICSC